MSGLRIATREQNKAYLDDMLWLPKSLVAETAIKDSLQYWDMENGKPVMRRLWDETRSHLICPREFIRISQYNQFPFPFIDLAPRNFPRVTLQLKNAPRDKDQILAASAFSRAQSGILNLACGKGKTFLSLLKVVEMGCPSLVVVHNGFLMDQWRRAIPEHVALPSGEEVGVIQGKTMDWKHPITVAMIQTLVSLVSGGKIPTEMRKWFGSVIFDEVHHLSAPEFCTTAPIVLGRRYGLTATHKRADGTDFIYKYHIGDVFHTDLVQDLIPRIYFQYTPVYVDLKKQEVRDKKGEFNLGRLRTFLGNNNESNIFRASCIKEALKEGRKVLAVSHSKDQLRILHELFPGSGLIVSEIPLSERCEIVRRSKLTLAIANLGFEGLDDDTLDTAFILLPFGSKDSPPNDLQQVMGRIQRPRLGRHAPVLVIFDDVRVKPLHGQCNTMRAQLKEWDKHVPGMPALEYQTLNAPNF